MKLYRRQKPNTPEIKPTSDRRHIMQMNMKHESGSIMCCVYRISDLIFLNTCYILFFNSQGHLIAPNAQNAKIVDLFFSTGISSTLFVDTCLWWSKEWRGIAR